MLPDAWAADDAAGWQKQVNALFNTLCIDESFFVTLLGTSVCQHVLNGVTFVLLQKGRAATLGMYGRYLTGGIDGTMGGAALQFAKTVGMRFGFCTAWNWFSSQRLSFPAYDIATARLEATGAGK